MTQENNSMPKIALGAWAWGNDGTFGGTLTANDLRKIHTTVRKPCGEKRCC